jgi:hypothetical protein
MVIEDIPHQDQRGSRKIKILCSEIWCVKLGLFEKFTLKRGLPPPKVESFAAGTPCAFFGD